MRDTNKVEHGASGGVSEPFRSVLGKLSNRDVQGGSDSYIWRRTAEGDARVWTILLHDLQAKALACVAHLFPGRWSFLPTALRRTQCSFER